MEDVKNAQLLPCLVRLSQLQSDNLDRLALREPYMNLNLMIIKRR